MLNFDKQNIDFACPACGFYNIINLKQARLRDVIICRGCKINICLDDQMNECRKAIRSIKKAIQKLEDSLGDLSIDIKI